ncbi:MAG: hypothetical protein QM755_09105 [Luteolibacter sp.]
MNGGVLEVGRDDGSLPASGIAVNSGGTFRSDTVGKSFTTLAAANNSTLALPALTGGTTTLDRSAQSGERRHHLGGTAARQRGSGHL